MDSESAALHFISPGALSSESVFDEYAADPRFQRLQTELRSWLFVGARSGGTTRAHSVTAGEDDTLTDRTKPGHHYFGEQVFNSAQEIPVERKLKYLKVWITDCAPWLDMFDQERHFGLQVPILAQGSSAVFNALLAVGARTAERQGNIAGFRDSLGLYSQAISSLTSSLNTKEPNVVVAACLLCVLEMMSVSPRDWRKHVEGCAALFVASGINGFSGGLLQAVFWCYARMDLCGAIIADGAESTVMPIDKWALLSTIPPSRSDALREIKAVFWEQGRRVPDMYANYAVYLCARTCDLLSRHIRCVELGEENGCIGESFEGAWNDLWTDLQEWLSKRPQAMLPVDIEASSAEKGPFPHIFFAHWAAISSTQLYHTACILLLDIKPSTETEIYRSTYYSRLWHARRIVGISLTNPHAGCINNAIQPLYVAGKLFTHPDEQNIIVNLIDSIEARTGWGSRWRIKDLKAAWGYPRGA
ncbi:hypothetical protein AYL99_00943 [Fonsecaea erecta]|uniref:Transcription factor domain-containing protein n=1 Tax=Fonsecaea erecta TaxID=1367422 RepID=A0A179A048_9EURO|nr:hypothetical protein AYL99_00943 [Fonsecaea erecta]OAP64971.1 hypothetical protein AYL99_00943 [Fonsecaea erecta]